jgi:hypothetical protein
MPIVGITVSPAQTRRVSIVSESPRSARFSFPRSLDTEAGPLFGRPILQTGRSCLGRAVLLL